MAGTIIADNVNAASTSTLILKNGVSSAPPQFQDGDGTQIGTLCRAWVSFNGTGTVAIIGSFNVSSITDNGTGLYTLNFNTAFIDTNYSANCTGNGTLVMATADDSSARTVSTLRVRSLAPSTGASTDGALLQVSVFR